MTHDNFISIFFFFFKFQTNFRVQTLFAISVHINFSLLHLLWIEGRKKSFQHVFFRFGVPLSFSSVILLEVSWHRRLCWILNNNIIIMSNSSKWIVFFFLLLLHHLRFEWNAMNGTFLHWQQKQKPMKLYSHDHPVPTIITIGWA